MPCVDFLSLQMTFCSLVGMEFSRFFRYMQKRYQFYWVVLVLIPRSHKNCTEELPSYVIKSVGSPVHCNDIVPPR